MKNRKQVQITSNSNLKLPSHEYENRAREKIGEHSVIQLSTEKISEQDFDIVINKHYRVEVERQ